MPHHSIQYPPRISLAQIPTPMHRLDRISRRMGVDIYIKRDDMTGIALSGNKIRKLEFVMAQARAMGADTVITCGGAQSNHSRATAVAAAQMGLKSLLFLRTPDPQNPPPVSGNILLDRMAGADIQWITPEAYRRRDQLMADAARSLKDRDRNAYVIPEGASDAVGAWGYVRAFEELTRDIEAIGSGTDGKTTIIHATGSGGTSAGLLIGAALLDSDLGLATVNVCDDRDYFTEVIGGICARFTEKYPGTPPKDAMDRLEIVDGYVGRGYALSRPEELALICRVARKEGIFLDPVYTGKAFYGMVKELEKDRRRFGERIVFIHTGGLFGLFPKSEDIASILKERHL